MVEGDLDQGHTLSHGGRESMICSRSGKNSMSVCECMSIFGPMSPFECERESIRWRRELYVVCFESELRTR